MFIIKLFHGWKLNVSSRSGILTCVARLTTQHSFSNILGFFTESDYHRFNKRNFVGEFITKQFFSILSIACGCSGLCPARISLWWSDRPTRPKAGPSRAQPKPEAQAEPFNLFGQLPQAKLSIPRRWIHHFRSTRCCPCGRFTALCRSCPEPNQAVNSCARCCRSHPGCCRPCS